MIEEMRDRIESKQKRIDHVIININDDYIVGKTKKELWVRDYCNRDC